MCSHIWATLIWCIVCVSLKKNWSPSWRSKPRFQSIIDSRPPVPPFFQVRIAWLYLLFIAGSQIFVILAITVPLAFQPGLKQCLVWSNWLQSVPLKNPFGVSVLVCQYVIPQFFFSEYLYLYIYRYIDSIFLGGFHQESHTCVTWTQCCDVFSPKKALEMSVDAGTLSTLSALNCMAGGSLDPSLVLLDSILNAIAIWGMFQNGVGSQKRLMFK